LDTSQLIQLLIRTHYHDNCSAI